MLKVKVISAKIGWLKYCLIYCLGLAILIGLIMMSGPDFKNLGLRVVPSDKIWVLDMAASNRPQQLEAATGALKNYQQFRFAGGTPRQYHFKFDGSKTPAILIPSAGGSFELWINGIPAGDSNRISSVGPGLGNNFITIEIAEALLLPDVNRADIIMKSDFGHVGIRHIYAGSAKDVAKAADAVTRQHYIIKIGMFFAVGAGIIAVLFGLMLRRTQIPYVGGLMVCVAMIFYISVSQNYVDISKPGNVFRFMPIVSMFGSGIVLCNNWQLKGAVNIVYAILATTAFAASLCGVTLNWTSFIFDENMAVVYFASFGLIPLPLIGHPIVLAADLIAQRNEIKEARFEIAAKQEVIEFQEQELHKQIRIQAVAEERQRFVRDMHDGVGGQLLGLLMRVRSRKLQMGDVEQEIQNGIADLRLVADALDNVGEDVGQALRTFYNRAHIQLQAANIEFIWKEPSELQGINLETREILNIYRIMQEALANTIRHSGASCFAIRFVGGAGRTITIEDNGRGFNKEQIIYGRGLNNIVRRASNLGAKLAIAAGPDGLGTQITLSFPHAIGSGGAA